MRIQIEFEILGRNQLLPFNYQYPISSWIYKVISKGNDEFASFLHNEGYATEQGKQFKFFTFSQLRFPRNTYKVYQKDKDYMEVKARKAWLDISFYLPEQLQPFVAGLFKDQNVIIGDKKHQLSLKVVNVQMQNASEFEEGKQYSLRTKSAVVLGELQNDNPNEQYILPTATNYTQLIVGNILDKCRAVNITDITANDIDFRINKLTMKTNLQRIKANTPKETKVKGYYYEFFLKAPAKVMKMLYATGIGSMNSLGFGMWEEIEKPSCN